MKKWEVTFWAGDIMEQGCSCCSNPTTRLRNKRFRWKWTAEVYRWWIGNGPVLGMQVFAPINPVRRFTQLRK